MSKIDNYIILSIAEKVYEIFKKTNFSTYSSFCVKFGIVFNSDTMSQREVNILFEIIDEINLLYGFDDSETMKYISVFFKFNVDDFGDYYRYLKGLENTCPLLFIDKLG
jgi:ABC-type microcin C transport system permease subunit YejB